MSLINQMLKDLDARHEADARTRLHREVRALPATPAGTRGLRFAVVTLALALLLAALVWAWSNHYGSAQRTTPEAAPSAVVPPPATMATAVPAQEAAVRAPADAAAANLSAPAAATAEQAVADGTPDGLRMSAALERIPTAAPTSAIIGEAPAAGASPSPRREPVPAARKAKEAPAATVPPPATIPLAPRVDKQPAAAVPRNPREQVDADYRRALALVNGARSDEAIALLLESLGRDGGDAATRQLLVRLLIEQRRGDEAAALLAEGLVRNPGQVAWAMTLARLRVDAGDPAAAARVLQAAQPYAGGNADFAGFAGHLQHRLGNHRAAAEHYRAAARLAPGDGRWWLGLGLALEGEQHGADAREAFLRARASGSLNADLAALVEQKLRGVP